MQTFKSISDVDRVRDDPSYDTLRQLVVPVIAEYTDSGHPYRPEDDGYLVLIERDDVDRVLDDLDMPYRLAEVPFEGVSMIDGYFYAIYLPNNQFALGFLIPDDDWVNGELRRHLEEHLDP